MTHTWSYEDYSGPRCQHLPSSRAYQAQLGPTIWTTVTCNKRDRHSEKSPGSTLPPLMYNTEDVTYCGSISVFLASFSPTFPMVTKLFLFLGEKYFCKFLPFLRNRPWKKTRRKQLGFLYSFLNSFRRKDLHRYPFFLVTSAESILNIARTASYGQWSS